MSALRIPVDHLRYLLERVPANQLPSDWEKKLTSRDAVDRGELLRVLDNALGRKAVDELKAAWSERGGRAVFLWNLAKHPSLSSSDAMKGTRKTFGKVKLGRPLSPEGHLSEKLEERIQRVFVGDNYLEAWVGLLQKRSFPFEGTTKTELASNSVRVVIDFDDSDGRVLQAFASAQDAKRAAKCVLRDILLIDVSKAADLKDHLVPISPNEKHVAKLRRELKMKQSGLKGPDARGKQGTVAVYGKNSDGEHDALDEADQLVSGQDKVKNHEREFRFSFTHVDDYNELACCTFRLKARHSHVTFTSRTSNPAMSYMVKKVRDVTAT